jgi:ribosomal protein S18 acetylase RimI-like enzyme
VGESKVEVVSLSRTDLSAAVGVLSHAFATEPMVNYAFSVSNIPLEDSLRALFHFSCEVRLLLAWPLLGTMDEKGELAGVAGFSLPGEVQWPQALATVYEAFKTSVGPESAARIEEYSYLADLHRPPLPHYQLGMIGVHPRAQGKGHARALIRTLHQMSDADPESIGVWLDTSDPHNVSIYEHLGYRVIAQEPLEQITVWGMFRPKQG